MPNHNGKNKTANDPNPLYLDFNFDLNYDDEFNSFHQHQQQQQQNVSFHDPNAMLNVANFGVDQHPFYQYAQEPNGVHHHQHHPEQHQALAVADPNAMAYVDFSDLVNSATSGGDQHPDQLVFAATNQTPIQYYIDETSGQLVIKEQQMIESEESNQIIVCKPRRVKQPVKRVKVKDQPEPDSLAEPNVESVKLMDVCRIRPKRKQTHSAMLELLDDDFDFGSIFQQSTAATPQSVASPEPNRKVSESISGTPFRPSKRLLEKNWKNFSRKRLLSSLEPSDSDDWKTDQECEMQQQQQQSSSVLRDLGVNHCDDERPIRLECVDCKQVFRTKRLFIAHKKQCIGPPETIKSPADRASRMDDDAAVGREKATENTQHLDEKTTSRKKRILL